MSSSSSSPPVRTKRDVPEDTKEEQGSPKKAKTGPSSDRERLEAFLKKLEDERKEALTAEDRDKIQSKAMDVYLRQQKETLLVLTQQIVYISCGGRPFPGETPDATREERIKKLLAAY